MEIQQQSVKQLMVHHNTPKKLWFSHKGAKESEKFSEPINGTPPRLRWKKIFFHHQRSPPPPSSKPNKTQNPPEEFLCPISGSLMEDPVIVSSGHSFDRSSVQACKNLNFTPQLSDGTMPDFSTVIPNLALKSSILKWCQTTTFSLPHNPTTSAENLVRTLMVSKKPDTNVGAVEASEKKLMIEGVKENPPLEFFNHAETEVPIRQTHLYSSSSEESIATASTSASTPPLQLSTRPSCCSSSSPSPSSSEIEPSTTTTTITPEEEEIMAKLRNPQVFIIEEALVSLRKITRTKEERRVQLCTTKLLSSLRSLIVSKYTNVQVNALASVVNLSLEKMNKVKIVRSGIVPPLIDVLKCGSSEAQEHASGALFSLALDDDNKTAIGVLGALSPLIHMLRSESERTRHDSALALYHLSLVQSNRAKMVKLGSVPVLLGMVKSGHMTGRILLILGNLGHGSDGRAAMLDAGAVECLVGLLSRTELGSGSTRESCVAVMYALSHGGLRFKAVAKAAGVVEVMQKVEKMGSERAKEKVRRILEMMRGKDKEEEDVDWEELLDSGLGHRTRGRLSSGLDESTSNSV
ncbi:U-box domain-containing protein 40-like [Gastrolobium bilobum]|uniref:U-box domain-containing protein 40-like n=1 Tax=Gastrolobium bilobum TaxID=150636 RepID=UPI002AB0D18A|nr:U-box domain-containing protein 40-like [Gastrolobium bilobum]